MRDCDKVRKFRNNITSRLTETGCLKTDFKRMLTSHIVRLGQIHIMQVYGLAKPDNMKQVYTIIILSSQNAENNY